MDSFLLVLEQLEALRTDPLNFLYPQHLLERWKRLTDELATCYEQRRCDFEQQQIDFAQRQALFEQQQIWFEQQRSRFEQQRAAWQTLKKAGVDETPTPRT
jgi:hypothetical protein